MSVTTVSVENKLEPITILKVQEVSDLELSACVIKPGTLYKLRTKYPLIDYVGYLQDSSKLNMYWLVYIQVSLQIHKDHEANIIFIYVSPEETKSDNASELFTTMLEFSKQ